jgi:hypothetical protein
MYEKQKWEQTNGLPRKEHHQRQILGRTDQNYLVSVVGRPELWKQWGKDPESFERAVLANLEQSVSGQVT